MWRKVFDRKEVDNRREPHHRGNVSRRVRGMTACSLAAALLLTGCTAPERSVIAILGSALNGGEFGAKTDVPTDGGLTDVPTDGGLTDGGLDAPLVEMEYMADTSMAAGAYYSGNNGMKGWQQPDWNTEEYSYNEENGWANVQTSRFSTFAADVDTASYANLRRMITNGERIPADAVRIEEMINYFHYDYPEPKEGEPFSVTTQIAPCPWNADSKLLLVGLAAPKMQEEELPPSNLVFLVDVSGSMDEPDKLPLVQRAFKLLVETLGEKDTVSLVTYAGEDSIVLDGVNGENKAQIVEAIEDLMAGGGTNGEGGITAAYKLAQEHFIEGGNNRVILATDGDFNIGISDEGSLTRLIQEKAKSGTFLSVLGFGYGNISDTNMEAMADHGNGNYNYIDDVGQARKVLVSERGGTLQTVAKDVKLQVEFNPSKVKGYRLIGYENRVMAAEDFADDTKDGGEIGAGHQMTALYEIALKDSKQEVPQVSSRYGDEAKDVDGDAGVVDDDADDVDEYVVDGTSEFTLLSNGETEVAMTSVDETEPAVDPTFTHSAGEDEYLAVNIRYKEPDAENSHLLIYPVTSSAMQETMSDDMSWAAGVAQFGMYLKESKYLGTTDLTEVNRRLKGVSVEMDDPYRDELVWMVNEVIGRGEDE